MAICRCSSTEDGGAVHNEQAHSHPRKSGDTSYKIKGCKCKRFVDKGLAKVLEQDPDFAKLKSRYL